MHICIYILKYVSVSNFVIALCRMEAMPNKKKAPMNAILPTEYIR